MNSYNPTLSRAIIVLPYYPAYLFVQKVLFSCHCWPRLWVVRSLAKHAYVYGTTCSLLSASKKLLKLSCWITEGNPHFSSCEFDLNGLVCKGKWLMFNRSCCYNSFVFYPYHAASIHLLRSCCTAPPKHFFISLPCYISIVWVNSKSSRTPYTAASYE